MPGSSPTIGGSVIGRVENIPAGAVGVGAGPPVRMPQASKAGMTSAAAAVLISTRDTSWPTLRSLTSEFLRAQVFPETHPCLQRRPVAILGAGVEDNLLTSREFTSVSLVESGLGPRPLYHLHVGPTSTGRESSPNEGSRRQSPTHALRGHASNRALYPFTGSGWPTGLSRATAYTATSTRRYQPNVNSLICCTRWDCPHMFERRPSPRSVLLPVLWEGPAKPLAGSVLVFTKDQWG